MDNNEQKFILIKRKTRLEDLIEKYNTLDQAKFYIEHMGIDFDDYLLEDRNYQTSIQQCIEILNEKGKVQVLDRLFLTNFIFGRDDIVVVVGQDGLVANTLKYLNDQKVIAINPDPKRWDGILLPFEVKDLKRVIEQTIKNERNVKHITMAKATLNDGQYIYGVNDLFVGQRSHVSSRYNISIGDQCENQSSSGIIISTGLGSTGWLKSILAGAARIVGSCTNSNVRDLNDSMKMPWDSEYLYYSVREPYKSRTTGDSIVFGKIDHKNPMNIQSQMPSNGCVFSDGIEDDYLEFNSGMEVTISIAEKKGRLIV